MLVIWSLLLSASQFLVSLVLVYVSLQHSNLNLLRIFDNQYKLISSRQAQRATQLQARPRRPQVIL